MVMVTESGMNRYSSEWYRYAQFDMYHIYGVWLNSHVKVFDEPRLG